MGALSESEEKFEEARGSSRFAEAWEALKAGQPSLGRFSESEDLRDFCQDPSIPYPEQDPVVLVLCRVAREEAQARAKSRFATDLVTWIFLPALWKVAEQAATTEILPPREIEAEVLSGFWEQAVCEHESCEGLSGRLVNAGRHRVWRVIRSRLKEDHPTLESLSNEEAPDVADPIWSDPWVLLSWARLRGKIKESEAELIFWTRLQGEPLDKICTLLGFEYEAGRARRKRAERRIARWLGQLGEDYPPRIRNSRASAWKSRVNPQKSRKFWADRVSQIGPQMCWESEGPNGCRSTLLPIVRRQIAPAGPSPNTKGGRRR